MLYQLRCLRVVHGRSTTAGAAAAAAAAAVGEGTLPRPSHASCGPSARHTYRTSGEGSGAPFGDAFSSRRDTRPFLTGVWA
jgi:hypothetical protein